MEQSIERSCGQGPTGGGLHWDAIDWNHVEDHVRRLQERIFRVTRDENWKQVKNLQLLLAGSLDARLVAVKRVTRENEGKYTAGVDGKIYPDAKSREILVAEIRDVAIRHYKCQPVRRVYIPKPDKDEKRPLGIPTIKDRVIQMVVDLALEAEWEAKFEPNSYGFRPGRRTMDAVLQIWSTIKEMPRGSSSPWILDADIKKCFDNIDHEALLARIPVFRDVIRRWLKAGAIEFGRYLPTKAGTPQGGVISPLLANIALDGMERLFGAFDSKGNYVVPAARRRENKGVSLVRYADDFVDMAPSRERIINHVIPSLREFLGSRGLVLSDAKTRIVHRDEGLDFLGFNIRQFHGSGGPICLIRPSKKGIQRHLRHVKTIVKAHRNVAQGDLIRTLNPVLRGWANYYRFCNAKEAFEYVDHRVWMILWAWCKLRHGDKSCAWIRRKYFRQMGTCN
jgi:RNA-directed DNA polymerase